MGPLRRVLRGGARAPFQGHLLRDRESPRRGGAHAGRVPETLERWDEIHRITDPTGYLFRVALNGFRMRHRRAAMAIQKVLPIPEGRDDFLDAEMRADVRHLLLRVTQRQRAALLLVDLLGYSAEQAGRILRVRPSTVRALATKGRRTLREAEGAWGA
jgi:DNA-directed RNA polymerase specialized sigma24 family protein